MSKYLLLALPLFLIGCASKTAHTHHAGRKQSGVASWYGYESGGTASGERYDHRALTAAHRTLPFGTRVRVTNLANRCCTVVRINDRGPYAGGRIIDVSKAAARELNMIRSGIARVEVEVIHQPPAKPRQTARM